ncbi:MAG: hypothetical protein V4647_13890 [Pseudomonadota bacterium]
MRLSTVGFVLAALTIAVPAAAGTVVPVPGPEAGVGLGALAALGVSYAFLRAKLRRN